MGQGYLMDTNVIIDLLIGKLPSASKKKLSQIEPAISVITHIELFSSNRIQDHELLQLNAFIKAATIFDIIAQDIVLQAISIRKVNKTKTPDAIIAATALAYNLTLITRNTKDFSGIPKLNLFNPWEIE
jgi:predicted nucleic acid-binding protein